MTGSGVLCLWTAALQYRLQRDTVEGHSLWGIGFTAGHCLLPAAEKRGQTPAKLGDFRPWRFGGELASHQRLVCHAGGAGAAGRPYAQGTQEAFVGSDGSAGGFLGDDPPGAVASESAENQHRRGLRRAHAADRSGGDPGAGAGTRGRSFAFGNFQPGKNEGGLRPPDRGSGEI